MDIEKDSSEKSQEKQKKQNFAKPSIKSRKSDESIFSNPYAYLQNPKNYINYAQKMSIESNVSEKLLLNKRKSDLFQHLTNQTPNSPYKHRHSRISAQMPLNTQIQVQQPFPKRSIGANQIYMKEDFVSSKLQYTQFKIEEPVKVLEVIKQQEAKIVCKCYKSKCLQLYCECFSKGIMCSSQCQCYQCRNNPDFKDKLEKAKNAVLQKDPEAFSNKLQIIGNIEVETNLANKKGCNCKKTLCFKKYCECFYSGVKCTFLCKCQNCLNGGERPFKE